MSVISTIKKLASPSNLHKLSHVAPVIPDFVQIELKVNRATEEIFGYDIISGKILSISELREQATNGNPHAQCAMGDYYANEGEAFNPQNAFKWYEKAAQQDHAKAQGFTASFCLSGLGTKKDNQRAEYWAKKSAQQNSPTGMQALAHCYIRKDDYASAIFWLERADAAGHPDAKEFIEIVKQLQGKQNVTGKSDSVSHNEHDTVMPNNSKNTSVISFEKVQNMLQTIHRDRPEAFASSFMFKSIAADILRNDHGSRKIIRWLDIAMFELNALSLLKESYINHDNFAMTNLINGLISEGASKEIAKEVIGYLAIVAEL